MSHLHMQAFGELTGCRVSRHGTTGFSVDVELGDGETMYLALPEAAWRHVAEALALALDTPTVRADGVAHQLYRWRKERPYMALLRELREASGE
jgi:hypothetical protein